MRRLQEDRCENGSVKIWLVGKQGFFLSIGWPVWKQIWEAERRLTCLAQSPCPMKSLFSQEVDVSSTTIEESVLIQFIHLFIHCLSFLYYVSDTGNKKVNKSWSLAEMLIHGRDRQNNYKSVQDVLKQSYVQCYGVTKKEY